ncbi:ATP-binding cassette domain-containing protein [Mycobacterium sp.]|uniref:ATP-binding cassette domain-containing protein n=1 Tax=Mycobacterium sp. TaxID=1785 RepID=UPI003A890F23
MRRPHRPAENSEVATIPDPFPLTVWAGPTRYVFAPGRDVIVGRGGRCDIRLDPPEPGETAADGSPAVPDLVLRFAGTHWLAVDRSRRGLYADGRRNSTVDIRDGQTIVIGDPARGPRLTFRVGAEGTAPAPRTERISVNATPASAATEAIRHTPQTGRLPLRPGARTTGVAATALGLTADGNPVLTDISFSAQPGSLIAVTGPSPAHNRALTGLLAGTGHPTSGTWTVDGDDVYSQPAVTRMSIGVVRDDDRVHPRLSVQRTLEFAAELRLPPGTSAENRNRVVDQILDELALTPHRKTRTAGLPPGLRRCVSLAVELLSRPSLLVVEDPVAGLDPEQQNHIMGLLRLQADLGCVVVVTGTSAGFLDSVNTCDQVLLLTPAGRLAFAGRPSHLQTALGTTEWSEIFARISNDPRGVHRTLRARQQIPIPPPRASAAQPGQPPAFLSFAGQFRWAVRRQVRLLLANPVSSVLLLLPFALGALTLLIPGSSGLGRPEPSSANPHEALEILAALNFAAVLMGITATVGAVVAERRIFRRDQSIGLSATAYLLAKTAVFGTVAALQAAILTAVVIAGKGGPEYGAVLLGNADAELYASVSATAVVHAILGLALSSLGTSMRAVLPLAVPAVLASLLFAGGLVSLVGTWGYDQLSWLVPAQWGFAAAASTANLRRVDDLAADNALWTHYAGWWVFDMVALAALGALWAGFVRYRLRTPVRPEA